MGSVAKSLAMFHSSFTISSGQKTLAPLANSRNFDYSQLLVSAANPTRMPHTFWFGMRNSRPHSKPPLIAQ
jgi:hypothetical protein